MIWVGADGTVQLCYVTFKLGNLHEKRLTEMLFTPEHTQASRDAFVLNCPNCHCQRYERIETDKASRRLYSIPSS
jgi:cyclic pyranopterin phosphate synthase